ncbi:thioredoxin-like protein [Hyaloscypha sp. PMI_1271]|nr:thioredoxin-like protein [Hyaloscypha sp. PMI_1271]
MVLKIYGHPTSTCTQRVLFTLEELGAHYELCLIDMPKGEHKTPTYIKTIHPFGRIPALEDSNFNTNRLFESRAICRYIAECNPGKLGGKPTNTKEVAVLEQALSVDFSYFDPTMKSLGYACLFRKQGVGSRGGLGVDNGLHSSFMGYGRGDQKKIDELTNQLRTVLDYYEWQLGQQEYLSGKEFSLIDIYTAPWIAFLPKINIGGELDSRPNVKAWWGKVSARPAWGKVISKLE